MSKETKYELLIDYNPMGKIIFHKGERKTKQHWKALGLWDAGISKDREWFKKVEEKEVKFSIDPKIKYDKDFREALKCCCNGSGMITSTETTTGHQRDVIAFCPAHPMINPVENCILESEEFGIIVRRIKYHGEMGWDILDEMEILKSFIRDNKDKIK